MGNTLSKNNSCLKVFTLRDDKLVHYRETPLTMDEVKEIIIKYPSILPFTRSKHCCVLRYVPLKEKYVDPVIVVKEKGGLDLYALYFDWYEMGSNAETAYPSLQEAYWSLGVQIEDVDEELPYLSYEIWKSKSKQVRELRKTIREKLGIKRIKVNDAIAVIVVDKLTNRFKEVIDAVNEITDTLVYAMELKAYRKNKEHIYIAQGYEWS